MLEVEEVNADAEFERLMAHRKWKPGSSRYNKAVKDLQAVKTASGGATPTHTTSGETSAGSQSKNPEHATSVSPTASPPPESTTTPGQPLKNTTVPSATQPKRMKPVRANVKVILRGYEPAFAETTTPMDKYFAQWPEFKYDPTSHPIDAYEDLAAALKWNSRTYKAGYPDFYAATRKEFTWQIYRPRTLTVRKRVLMEVDGRPASKQRAKLEAIVDDEDDNQDDLALKAFNRLCLIFGEDRGANQKGAEKVRLLLNPRDICYLFHV